MISTVTLNPALDKTLYVTKLVPNETNRALRVEIDAGGKGINCARMLTRLGVETQAIAFLGGSTGEFIRLVLEKEGVPLDSVPVESPTRTCTAIEEPGGVPPTTVNEAGGPIEHRELVAFLEKTKDVSRASSFVVFGGSVPTGVNQDIYRVLIEIAEAGGAKAVLDADGEALAVGMKAKPFMIKPNRDELEQLTNQAFESTGDVARAALEIGERGIELVVVSLGKQGAIACYRGRVYSATAPEVKPVSSIGSGDSMTAGMLAALDRGAGMEDALRLGCAAGAATAMSSGSDIGSKEDIDRLISQVKITVAEPSS